MIESYPVLFEREPTYSRYRTLQLTNPTMKGEDIFALQTVLAAGGWLLGAMDGVLGVQTSDALVEAQKDLGLTVDARAGGLTQRALALTRTRLETRHHNLAHGALKGQLEFESGFRLGNYSPVRPDGSYDAGVAQRNTKLTPARQGFDVVQSVEALAERIREYYDHFVGVSEWRRWGLAQGAWNAPAFACYIANEEGANVPRNMTARPSDASRKTFEQYIVHATTYLEV